MYPDHTCIASIEWVELKPLYNRWGKRVPSPSHTDQANASMTLAKLGVTKTLSAVTGSKLETPRTKFLLLHVEEGAILWVQCCSDSHSLRYLFCQTSILSSTYFSSGHLETMGLPWSFPAVPIHPGGRNCGRLSWTADASGLPIPREGAHAADYSSTTKAREPPVNIIRSDYH
ncbi:hypothetical protein ASPBRDRAFT_641117 [Aspergillus brasiliensis CBS 101740]|uniref:Uncharacterized protein n=1 Tax=Aspergillus brasiliensis (strain CBS 101740 / IMI 381727 / IBT 21946) TaxID=767769 RepID=A0A1L9UDS2_ASPBC|nr:hypothetical protein ASPBRDRAFT_641117 [Aspergillus brasiliensis CBS 101740]